MKTGVELIAEERKRQIEVEGWTLEHDKMHQIDQLALVACCYAMPERIRSWFNWLPIWPIEWSIKQWWKPTPDDRVRELVKAGALIAAEIDRLQRFK